MLLIRLKGHSTSDKSLTTRFIHIIRTKKTFWELKEFCNKYITKPNVPPDNYLFKVNNKYDGTRGGIVCIPPGWWDGGLSHFSERLSRIDLGQIGILGGNWHFRRGWFFLCRTWKLPVKKIMEINHKKRKEKKKKKKKRFRL